jgi:hypothetical protein
VDRCVRRRLGSISTTASSPVHLVGLCSRFETFEGVLLFDQPGRNLAQLGIVIQRRAVFHFRLGDQVFEPGVLLLDRSFEFLDSLRTQLRIGGGEVVRFWTRAETGESSDRKEHDGGECVLPSARQAPGPGHRCVPLDANLGIHLWRFFGTGRVASSGRSDTLLRAQSFTRRCRIALALDSSRFGARWRSARSLRNRPECRAADQTEDWKMGLASARVSSDDSLWPERALDWRGWHWSFPKRPRPPTRSWTRRQLGRRVGGDWSPWEVEAINLLRWHRPAMATSLSGT